MLDSTFIYPFSVSYITGFQVILFSSYLKIYSMNRRISLLTRNRTLEYLCMCLSFHLCLTLVFRSLFPTFSALCWLLLNIKQYCNLQHSILFHFSLSRIIWHSTINLLICQTAVLLHILNLIMILCNVHLQRKFQYCEGTFWCWSC